jgi:hypothetical protein
VLQLVLARTPLHPVPAVPTAPGAAASIAKATKQSLMDVAYSMSLGLMSWSNLAAEADAAAMTASVAGARGGYNSATNAGWRATASLGFASPLSERALEARGRGFSGARGGGPNTALSAAASSATCSSLYESLLHAVLGCIACESDPAGRAVGYRLLQSVLMTLSGFGSSWSSFFPSPSSSAALLLHAGAFGLGGLLGGAGVSVGAGATFTLDQLAMTTLTHQNSSSTNIAALAHQPHGHAHGHGHAALTEAQVPDESKEAPSPMLGLASPPAARASGAPDLPTVDEKSPVSGGVDAEQSPSPMGVFAASSDPLLQQQHSSSSMPGGGGVARAAAASAPSSFPSSASSLAGSEAGHDLRAQRIPQILASCLDIQSQIHRGASSGPMASARRGGAGGMPSARALFAHGAGGVRSAGVGAPLGTVSLQDHKWILSLIYYEVTACFAAPEEAKAPTTGSAAGSGNSDASAAPKTPVGAVNSEPTSFQIASTILRPRGRGLTSDDNVALCFQLLILLLLQRLPSSSDGGVYGDDDQSTGSSSAAAADLASLQQILALQLPMVFTLLSFLRAATNGGAAAASASASASDVNSDASFALSASAARRLGLWLHAYLWFVSKLALVRVDSPWVRQQSVALEEALATAARAAQQARGESVAAGAEAAAAQAAWLFGLSAPGSRSHICHGPWSSDASSSSSGPSSASLLDPDALASILARLLVDPPPSSSGSASSASAAAAGRGVGSAASSSTSASSGAGGGGGSSAESESAADEAIAEQRAYLLDSASFEPFALKFLLPERAAGGGRGGAGGGAAGKRRFHFLGALVGGDDDDREASMSWAPSAMGGGGGGGGGEAFADEHLATGRVGSFFTTATTDDAAAAAATTTTGAGSGGAHGHSTPRQQYSPGLRARVGQSGPMGSPLALSSTSSSSGGTPGASSAVGSAAVSTGAPEQEYGGGGGGVGGGLVSVPQSPPSAAQSAAEMLAELDQQSFQAIAYACTKTVRETDTHCLCEVREAFVFEQISEPLLCVCAFITDVICCCGCSVWCVNFQSAKSGNEFLQFLSGLELSVVPSSAAPSPAVAPSTAATAVPALPDALEFKSSAPTTDKNAAAVDDEEEGEAENEWHPDAAVLAPLAPSTLDLFFPQLASFDLYLHSEIE